MNQNVFAAPSDTLYARAPHLVGESSGRRFGREPRANQPRRHDAPVTYQLIQGACDEFDFRKLWHEACRSLSKKISGKLFLKIRVPVKD